MKASELMVGDLVYLIDETSKVREFEITQVSTERVTGIIVDANNSYIRTSATDTYYNEERYRPIHLTAEILEKNGFSADYCNDDLSYAQSCGDVIGIHIYGKNGLMDEMYFKYVHHLQHALRLCGIEKEIIL